jgi:hypothetical protein
MEDRFAIRIISVPANCEVPTTLSPSSTFSFETVPSTGEKMVVRIRLSLDSFTEASALLTLNFAASSCACAD